MLNSKKMLFLLSWILIISLLFTSCNNSTTSLRSLKKDNGIVWMGEVTADYIFRENVLYKKCRAYQLENRGDVRTLIDGNEKYNEERLAWLLVDNSEDLGLYKDVLLKEKLSHCDTPQRLKVKDTLVIRKEREATFFLDGDFKSTDINAFRFKQLIYYQKNTMSFQSIPLAIAPLDFIVDTIAKKVTGLKPFFWMKPNEVSEIDWDNIEWGETLDLTFSTQNVRVIKEDKTFNEVIKMMMADIRANVDKRPVLETYSDEPMKEEEVKELGLKPTSALKIYSETYEEGVGIFDISRDENPVPKITIRQEWAWDKESRTLNIKYLGFLPVVNWWDSERNFVTESALFYRNPSNYLVTPD